MGDDATVTFKSHDSNLMIDVAAPPLRLLSHLRTWDPDRSRRKADGDAENELGSR